LDRLATWASFRLHLRINEGYLRRRQATLQLGEQVLGGLHPISERIYLTVTTHGTVKVGLHSINTSRKCIDAVREHLVVSLCLAVRDLHTQDVTLLDRV